jgi:3-deoxy-D-manno-octulosonic-acid transferase
MLLLYLGRRVARNRAYLKGLGERLGGRGPTLENTAPGGIWLHAVSVGEVLAALPLLRRIRAELPGTPLFVSTTTLAGRETAEAKLKGLASGVFFAPIDYRFAVRRVLRRLRPAAVVIMETEIWPNLFRETKRAGAGLMLVNARISDQTLGSYRRNAWFFRQALSYADAIHAQDARAQGRFAEIGAPANRVIDAGNLKYDFDPSAAGLADDLERLFTGPVWIAASTMAPASDGDPDEDDAVMAAYGELRARHPALNLVLVPRKPERFDAAAAKLSAAGIPFVRRTELASSGPFPGVLLLDTMGELAGLFRLADVVFMGGSLASRGGHNPLEPAAHGVPVIAGPHMENFADITELLERGGGLVRIGSADELAHAVEALLDDPAWRREVGARAREISASRRGATERAVQEIRKLLSNALFRTPHALWRRVLLGPFTPLWCGAVALDRARTKPQELTFPVVSIGNLSTGGTGKTPFTLWLAEELARRGKKPAILMRGFRREATQPIALLPGERAPLAETGDEAQLYIAAGHAALAIGQDRAEAAQLLEQRYKPDVYLLDDGFEHWALRRDLDIVLIDALDPFAGGLLPLGRLRESPAALARAGMIVITRARQGREKALEREIRTHNSKAPIFRAANTATSPVLTGRVGAFCALGEPGSFWQTLDDLGVQTVFRRAFPDHHVYTDAELESMSKDADLLLTTEKDLVKIDASRYRVSAVSLRLAVEGGEEILRRVEALL